MSSSEVEIRYSGTPVEYWRGNVRYDAWGDPYVRADFLTRLFGPISAMSEIPLKEGGYTDRLFTQWKLVSGPPVRFPQNRKSRGWRP